MRRLALLRHGATAWNAEHRLQGRADLPLTAESERLLSHRRLPQEFTGFEWFASPLLRARQTAAAIGLAPGIEPRLIEMDWGGYEGKTPAELRAADGLGFAANEALGLDLLPPHGESPRMVQERLKPWLAERAAAKKGTGAVTHKGVIRALLALAYDWPMLGKSPVKLDWAKLHLFILREDGSIAPDQANIALIDPETA